MAGKKKTHHSKAALSGQPELLRKHKTTILFNEKEKKAIDEYCKKYGIRNRSKFIREMVISNVIRKFETDYPTLF
jgi:hypothetical protein